MPKSLDLGRLKKFEPSTPTPDRIESGAQTRQVSENIDRWPSREPIADGQISIKGPLSTINRFKAICKDDRRTYADMLHILMDAFEKKS